MWCIFMFLLATAVSVQFDDALDQASDDLDFKMPSSIILEDGDTFDYIVVGAGAAGSAAAARLALAGADVLLVEAGGNPNILTRIPSATMSVLSSPLNWQYKTIPNNVSCLSAPGRACTFNSGKCLGGSTSINYMMYSRGNRKDYDDLNIPGWAWKDLEPYFLRFEGLQSMDKLPPTSLPYHNTSGPLKVGYFDDSENSWHERIKKGFEFLNFPLNYDVNAESQIGVSQMLGYVYKGERMSTARGYLAREDVKKVLKVTKYTQCTGVIIDDSNTARGITVVQGLLKRKLKLYARREVVLSAGAIGTAKILMLSGIGPAAHLRSLGIPVRADLPVGDNISDHVLPLMLMLVDRGTEVDAPNMFDLGIKSIQDTQWFATRDGPLASNGLTDITIFVNTHCYDTELRRLGHNSTDCELPTSQIIYAYIDRNILPATRLNRIIAQQMSDANVTQAVILASPIVLRPHSRGSIRLASADPLDPPAIFPNYLGDDRDLDEMIRGITILEHLVETPEFKAHHASVFHLKLPGCGTYEEDRERYLRCYCRHMTNSVFHAVGSARLGAVLDTELRVRTVKGLRVADLSALPELPRGNTEAVAIAIGERVVDFILQGYNKRDEL